MVERRGSEVGHAYQDGWKNGFQSGLGRRADFAPEGIAHAGWQKIRTEVL